MKYVGSIELNGTVDITDPCYTKESWCRMTVDCDQGLYNGYIETVDEGFGERVTSLSIYKGDKVWNLDEMECIGYIGVDAGLAGFFADKQDFSDDEWEELCEHTQKGMAWSLYGGIFSESGYGDGLYDVYANEEHSAFTIVFVFDDEYEEEDDE